MHSSVISSSLKVSRDVYRGYVTLLFQSDAGIMMLTFCVQAGFFLLLACFSGSQAASSFPHGTSYGDTVLGANDDGFSSAVTLPAAMKFFGGTASQIFFNNNGLLSFDGPVSSFTPSAFPGNIRMLAPYFADVDTRASASGKLHYRVSTSTADKNLATSQLQTYFDKADYVPDYVVVATWCVLPLLFFFGGDDDFLRCARISLSHRN